MSEDDAKKPGPNSMLLSYFREMSKQVSVGIVAHIDHVYYQPLDDHQAQVIPSQPVDLPGFPHQLDEATQRGVDQIAETVLELWGELDVRAAPEPAAPRNIYLGEPRGLLRMLLPQTVPAEIDRVLRLWGRAGIAHQAVCHRIIRDGLLREVFGASWLIAMVDQWLAEQQEDTAAEAANEAAATVLCALPESELMDLASSVEPGSPRAAVLPTVLRAVSKRNPLECVRVLRDWSKRGAAVVDGVLVPALNRLDFDHLAATDDLYPLQKQLLMLQVALRGSRAHARAGALVKQVRDQRSRLASRRRER